MECFCLILIQFNNLNKEILMNLILGLVFLVCVKKKPQEQVKDTTFSREWVFKTEVHQCSILQKRFMINCMLCNVM